MTSFPTTGTSSLLLCIIGTRCVLTQARWHRGQRQILTQNFPVLILSVFSTDPLCPSQRDSGGASCDVCTACHKLIRTPPPTKVGGWTWDPCVLFHVLYIYFTHSFFCFFTPLTGLVRLLYTRDTVRSRCHSFQMWKISAQPLTSVPINQAPTR